MWTDWTIIDSNKIKTSITIFDHRWCYLGDVNASLGKSVPKTIVQCVPNCFTECYEVGAGEKEVSDNDFKTSITVNSLVNGDTCKAQVQLPHFTNTGYRGKWEV